MTAKSNGRGGARPGAGRKPAPKIKQAEIQKPAAPSRRGGVRPGAGRKPKTPPTNEPPPSRSAVTEHLEGQPHGGALKRKKSEPVQISERDMLTLLQDIALGRIDATMLQVRAAVAAVQYTHTKKGDGGKKDEAADKAKKAASKFGALAPPLKLVNGKNGK